MPMYDPNEDVLKELDDQVQALHTRNRNEEMALRQYGVALNPYAVLERRVALLIGLVVPRDIDDREPGPVPSNPDAIRFELAFQESISELLGETMAEVQRQTNDLLVPTSMGGALHMPDGSMRPVAPAVEDGKTSMGTVFNSSDETDDELTERLRQEGYEVVDIGHATPEAKAEAWIIKHGNKFCGCGHLGSKHDPDPSPSGANDFDGINCMVEDCSCENFSSVH